MMNSTARENSMPYEGPVRCLDAIERMVDRGEEYTIRPVDHIYGLPTGGWEEREPFIGIPVDDSHLFAARADSDWPGVNDQDNEWGCDPPVFKAARNRNPAILRAIISRGFLDLLKQEAIYEDHARTLHNQQQHVHRPEYVDMRRGRGNRSPRLVRVRPWSPFRPCPHRTSPREYRRIRYHPDYEFYEGEGGGWEGTPLLHAVECKLEDNIRTLLDLEVNPNGVSLRALSKYAAVGDRSDAAQVARELNAGFKWEPKDEGMAQIQREFHLHGLTENEIKVRTRDHVIEPFWFVFCVHKTSMWAGPWRRHRVPTTSLLEAAKGGSVKIFDLLYQFGADATAWLRENNFDGTAVPHTYSALAPSTPLHAAIESDQLEMLQHLLTLGFNPDSRPLATIDRAITPLMSATMRGKLDFYDILVSHGANLHLKTPVMNVHHLHFAAGNLDLRMLRRIMQDIPLLVAGATVLGHTPLHVACLPFDRSFICIYSPKVYASIHDIRPQLGVEVIPETMGHMYRENHLVEPDAPVFTEPQDCGSFEKQMETVQYLLQNSASEAMFEKDIYGNTPLHYLAGYRTINEGLVSILRDQEGGQDIWNDAKNRWGHTPRDLWEDGRNCVEEQFKDFWNPDGGGMYWAGDLYPGSITFQYE